MSLTSDERDWLIRIEKKIDNILLHGCSKSELHADHEKRIRDIEVNINQAKGGLRMAHVLSGVIGAVLAFVANKIWK
jgi:hypothetical protein